MRFPLWLWLRRINDIAQNATDIESLVPSKSSIKLNELEEKSIQPEKSDTLDQACRGVQDEYMNRWTGASPCRPLTKSQLLYLRGTGNFEPKYNK